MSPITKKGVYQVCDQYVVTVWLLSKTSAQNNQTAKELVELCLKASNIAIIRQCITKLDEPTKQKGTFICFFN